MQIETEKAIADIIQKELGLTTEQIWIYNQDFVMPSTSGLFVVVGFGWSKTISSRNEIKETVDESEVTTVLELQCCNVLENIVISLMSKNSEARQRKNEILAALSSYYAQQIQEKYSFKIGRIPTNFINVSDAEGSTTINRYNITIPVYVWYEKEKQISTGDGADYYNDFTGNVQVENKSIDLKEIKGDT